MGLNSELHGLGSRCVQRYGEERHRAQLNFGGCVTYTTAVVAGDALLFVGDNFRHTDVDPVL